MSKQTQSMVARWLVLLGLVLLLGSGAVDRGECHTDWQVEVADCTGRGLE